jgi:DNA-binding response OmpR family regulator
MYKILIADDEHKIRSLIRKYAEFEGHTVLEAANGMEAIRVCSKNPVDLIIMDIMMPELDGFSTVKEIRKTTEVPVIMLSARGEEYDKIHGFELGIDDYVVKPFSPKELMMRVDAIMKRTGKKEAARQNLYSLNGLVIDFSARKVMIDGNNVNLSPKEYELLSCLVLNKNIALTREKLVTEVWGYDFYGDDRTLDTHIKLLRKNLGEYGGHIITLRGVGYRFEG